MNDKNLIEQISKKAEQKFDDILKKAEQKFDDILNYYKDFKDLKNDKYFKQHSIIISLTLLEIEKMKENFEADNVFKIPQYSFKYKKKFCVEINAENIDKNIVNIFLEKIEKIKTDLENLIGIGKICDNLEISVYDDIIELTDDDLINIIKDVYDSNLHEFYLNYLQELIKQKANDNYTKYKLDHLKIVKYITQILIFIKLFVKYKIEKLDPLTNEVINKISLNEEKSLVNFSLILISNTNVKLETFLSDNNDRALNELTNFYKVISKIIEKLEKN